MKKTLALCLAVLFALSLAGCQGNNDMNTPIISDVDETPTQSAETPTLSPTLSPTPSPSPLPSLEPSAPEPSAEPVFGIMDILVFGIGKADAILITTQNYTVIIDTGEDIHGQQIVEYLSNRDITVIDYLIITHFHKDHVGGADTILGNLSVKTVIVPDYGKDSTQYDQFLETMDVAGLESNALTQVLEFSLDDAIFTVYPSRQEYYDYGSVPSEDDDYDNNFDDSDEVRTAPKENNFSLVISVNHGENNFLFTGDAESKRLKETLSLDDIINTQYDFLKVPHHGRFNKRSAEFIYMIRPKYAVITCSMDRPADEEVVLLLDEVGAEVFYAIDRGVLCISDGATLRIAYETG